MVFEISRVFHNHIFLDLGLIVSTSKAVISIVLTFGSNFLICAINSMPLMPGILTSEITTENFFGFDLK